MVKTKKTRKPKCPKPSKGGKVKCEQIVPAKVDPKTGQVVKAAHRCNSWAMAGSNFCAAHTRKAKYGGVRCKAMVYKKGKDCQPSQTLLQKAKGVRSMPRRCKNIADPKGDGYCTMHAQLAGIIKTKTGEERKKATKKSCPIVTTEWSASAPAPSPQRVIYRESEW